MKVFGGKKNKHSGFWIPKSIQDAFSGVPVKGENENFTRLMRLAEIKRSIKNFVQILTGKSIPVQYLTEEAAGFTDGKTVYISGNIDTDLNFDKTVGLALHEASHIVLSSMEQLKAIQFEDVTKRIFNTVGAVRKSFDKHVRNTKNSVFSKEQINYEFYAKNLKDLLNWVEDRRVDAYIQKDSPGYVGYYEELYNEFFNIKAIKKLIADPKTHTPLFHNYMFHVINLISKYSDVNALRGLNDIKELVDLENILRLKNMKSSFVVAQKIFELILKNIDLTLQKEAEKQVKEQAKNQNKDEGKEDTSVSMPGISIPDPNSKKGKEDKEGKESDENSKDSDNKVSGEDVDSDENQNGESENSNGEDGNDNESNNREQKSPSKEAGLTDAQTEAQVKKVLNNISKLLNHEIKKQELPDGIANKVSTLSGMNVRIKTITMNHPNLGSVQTKVIIIPEFTKALVDQNMLPITYSGDYNGEDIDEGIKIGKKLVNKIKIRNESRQLLSPRQKNGRIQQRVLSDLAYDSENVFYKLTSEEYKDMHFHISVDASGSMDGNKWNETIKLITAITYSACKIKNINVVVDFRSYLTTNIAHNDDSQSYFPFVLKAFDSRTQSFAHFKELLNHIRPNGMTPEGMCFQAMIDEYVPSNYKTDSVFINFSDGYPGCEVQVTGAHNGLSSISYSDFGINHTKEMVKKIRKLNIKVISYYIGGYYSEMGYFKKMYGKDSESVSADNVIKIAKSINERLLKK